MTLPRARATAHRARSVVHRARSFVRRVRHSAEAAREAWRAAAPRPVPIARDVARASVDEPLVDAFARTVESSPALRAIAPGLHIDETARASGGEPARGLPGTHPRDAKQPSFHELETLRSDLRHEGFVVVADLLEAGEAAALARGVAALVSHGLPATMVYAFDEAWDLAARVAHVAGSLLDAAADVLDDLWAFHVPARDDAGGWPAHRGMYVPIRDAHDLPTLLTAWVAVTDAPAHGACMHFVPLHRDRAYPHDLGRVRVTAEDARAVPMRAGSVVLFDANVLHWGGASSRRAEPRTSITYSVERRGAGHGRPLRAAPGFEARLDLVADAFRTYGAREPGSTAAAQAWARRRAASRQGE